MVYQRSSRGHIELTFYKSLSTNVIEMWIEAGGVLACVNFRDFPSNAGGLKISSEEREALLCSQKIQLRYPRKNEGLRGQEDVIVTST